VGVNFLVTKNDVYQGLVDLGIKTGDLLMVHSSLSAIGLVEGGSKTVVDCLLDVIGQQGTLVVPTFTYPSAFPDSANEKWVFDPESANSGVGSITNEVIKRSDSKRSIHLWHSISAIGALAQQIVSQGGNSAWDFKSPMGWLLNNGASVLLLGVPYQNLTAIHVWEIEFEVNYRLDYYIERRVRESNGNLKPLFSRVYSPKKNHPGSDFNRLGEKLEFLKKVNKGSIGNAIARFFSAEDAYCLAHEMYKVDKSCFLKKDNLVTQLTFGKTINNGKGEQCVVC
tara:strand:+ start:6574 stop:7419 length:846 start_codon:yes stop_codon:yes gene_type:complete